MNGFPPSKFTFRLAYLFAKDTLGWFTTRIFVLTWKTSTSANLQVTFLVFSKVRGQNNAVFLREKFAHMSVYCKIY